MLSFSLQSILVEERPSGYETNSVSDDTVAEGKIPTLLKLCVLLFSQYNSCYSIQKKTN